MQKLQKGFWHYLELWRALFPRRRPLRWRGDWLQNGYCRDCRYCCGPQDSNAPFPMALLPGQLRPNLSDDFYRLMRAQRPVACGLFPLVPANGGLYLYKTCPAVIFTPLDRLADLGLEAARWLSGFNLADLRHISLELPLRTLADDYISLDITLFDENGVELRLN